MSDDVGIEAEAEIQVEVIKNRFEKGDCSARNEHEGLYFMTDGTT